MLAIPINLRKKLLLPICAFLHQLHHFVLQKIHYATQNTDFLCR